MISTRWLEKRQPHWKRLEELVRRSDRRGVSALSHSELQELGLLYRQIASDLGTVREDAASRHVAAYLNQLLGRTHNLVYMSRKPRLAQVATFFRYTYPAVFRETLPYTVAAFVLFVTAAIAAVLVSLSDPGFQRFLIGDRMADTIERREMWTHSIVTVKPLASSAIMTNNMAVAFAAFAGGIMAGLGTIYILLTNGVLMGVIATATWQSGMAVQLWSFVAPHGVLELPAIFIAGGSGLMLGRALLFPGLLPRRDALSRAAIQAVRLLMGTIPMLVVAGIVEAFLSPSFLPSPVKFVFAGVVGVLLVGYLTGTAKQPSTQTQAGVPVPHPTSGPAP